VITRPIRVAVVDDQPLVRSGLQNIITAEPDMLVVGQAASGEGALELLRDTPVDVMLLDVRMAGMDGIETTRRIMAAGYPVRIIILTTFDVDEYVLGGLAAGASGFLLKDLSHTMVTDAIRSVHLGDAVIAPQTIRRLMFRMIPDPGRRRADPRLAQLTDREYDVLQQVVEGANNLEIAETLHMAEGTVKTHISRLLAKLQARDRVGLVLEAHRMGMLESRSH
jgi:DNA-binding NarL/FixJ family response regulator